MALGPYLSFRHRAPGTLVPMVYPNTVGILLGLFKLTGIWASPIKFPERYLEQWGRFLPMYAYADPFFVDESKRWHYMTPLADHWRLHREQLLALYYNRNGGPTLHPPKRELTVARNSGN